MLSRIFGSNARVKILKLMLLNPNKKYYIRQLARYLKLQVNSVRRELSNLEKFGILISNVSRDENETEDATVFWQEESPESVAVDNFSESSEDILENNTENEAQEPSDEENELNNNFVHTSPPSSSTSQDRGEGYNEDKNKEDDAGQSLLEQMVEKEDHPQSLLVTERGATVTKHKVLGGKQEKKYYQANVDFVLFNEIKALVVKSQVLYEKDITEKLKALGSIKFLVLSGIFVNDEEAAVDLLVVGQIRKPDLVRVIREVEKEIGKEINYSLMDIKEFKHRREMTDVFLYNIFEANKIVAIDELGIGA
jgi:hypothetical protein